jgi:hypothetical protein
VHIISAINAVILRSAQKYLLYVNSLIVARKQMGYKSKKIEVARSAYPQVSLGI